jgi:hypothetical protein
MNNQPAKCGQFAGKLRKQLMLEHLGLTLDNVSSIEDCISDGFYKGIWLRRASLNTKFFHESFLCIPTDEVRSMEANRKFLIKRPLAETDKYDALQRIKHIEGIVK